jgi:20S proteasome subunit beta 2
VCLAADTRATSGETVADKNCDKLHNMAPNIYCAGAGTAADCDHVTEMIKRELELLRLNTHT